MRCVLGDGFTSILQLFEGIDETKVMQILASTIIPIATEILYKFHGFDVIQTILESVYGFIQTIMNMFEPVTDALGELKELFMMFPDSDDMLGATQDLANWLFGRRELSSDDVDSGEEGECPCNDSNDLSNYYFFNHIRTSTFIHIIHVTFRRPLLRGALYYLQ